MALAIPDPRVSSHHGSITWPNVLPEALRVLEEHPEIDILEIDFISWGQEILSSHDYNEESARQGASLFEWIHAIVYRNRRLLWIDIKENLFILRNCSGYNEPFDTGLFFRRLDYCQRFFSGKVGRGKNRSQVSQINTERPAPLDIAPYIIIGCQHPDTLAEISQANAGRYAQVVDIPSARYYVYQRLLPTCLLNNLTRNMWDDYAHLDYTDIPLLSLDMSFFERERDLKEFLSTLRLAPSARVVLYNAPLDMRPIEVEQLHIIMQYDYP